MTLTCLCLAGCGILSGLFDGMGDDYYDNSDHEHIFENYFTYATCTVDGCNVVGRLGSEDTYAKDFVYSLTGTKISQINALYAEILTDLDVGEDYEQFETMYEEYVEWLEFVGFQYQVSSVLYDVKYNIINAKNYNTASKLYNEMYANYYDLFERIYNSNYVDEFYDGWTDSEIEDARHSAAIYGGNGDNNNEVDEILSEYSAYMDTINWNISTSIQLNAVGEIYGRFVEAKNKVAKSAQYDNFMYYAYANDYNRDYTPDDVAAMRSYVKEYVAPIFAKVAARYRSIPSFVKPFNSSADQTFYYGLMDDSLFTSRWSFDFDEVKPTIDYISQYFNYLNRPSNITGGKDVNFYGAVEDLFKNGNYFTGEHEGAYTWWINGVNTPIVYFGPSYDTAFTFVHEFGHYYENIYNGNLHLSYDLDETHSQGNEMLFLAWLAQNKPSGVTNGFDYLEIYQLYDMLSIIVLATAVDEFEQAAYSGYYNGQPVKGYSYANLFKTILSSYNGADQLLNNSYWGYVVFDNAAYYISYAMSALPSIELYAKAKSKGLYEARDSYVKLFTFANDSRFVATDASERKYLTEDATYGAILNYCGLQGPFELGLYTSLQSYFSTRTDLK